MEQDDDRNVSEECREPDIGTAFAAMSEISGADYRGQRNAKVGFISKHPLIAIVEAKSGTT